MPTAAVAARKAGRNLGGRPRGSLGERTWRDAINLAVRELRDETTKDGKAMQGVDLKMDVTITGIERRIIDVAPGIVGIDHLEGEAAEVIEAKPGEVEPIVTNLLPKDVVPETDAG